MTIQKINPADLLPIRWYVVFTDGTPGREINGIIGMVHNLLTTPGYRHCFLITRGELGSILYDPHWFGLSLSWAPQPPEAVAKICLDHGHKVLMFEQKKIQSYALRGIMTCVSAIKMAIGIKKWWIITPKQLYKRMLRQGAHIITKPIEG